MRLWAGAYHAPGTLRIADSRVGLFTRLLPLQTLDRLALFAGNRVGKNLVSLRVDQDVLAWFRKQGKGYLTRMNAVLRSYMEAHFTHRP
jgi:BrnA antitoxin of type II toxin-antitoxin system